MAGPFVVATGELSRHPGTRRRVTRTGRLRGVGLSTSRLTDDDVVVDVTLEGQGTTLTATGTVTGRWSGECRRCLEATGGDLVVELHEVFTPDPVEGETYELGRDHVDLEPAVREAVALALPLAPLCDEACAGPDPEGHPVVADAGDADDDAGDDGEPVDHRWAALDALRFDA
ncbi:MAG TPA: DUF177 domain-containing protein [Acidimicrobiales bacterium]